MSHRFLRERCARRASRRPARSRVPAWSQSFLKALHHFAHVLDGRRAFEAVLYTRAPHLEIFRAAEVDGVVLQRLPLHEQTIARGVFLRPLQREALATLGALE